MGLPYALTAIRKRGLSFIYTYLKESVWFDLRFGTRTSSRVPKDQQSINSSDCEAENGLLYVASFSSVTNKALDVAERLLGKDGFSDSQFFDFGCGKGKALLLYALRCRKSQKHTCVGIEYDPSLAEIACENVARCRLDPAKVSVVADSALNFPRHVTSNVLIVYLYNSFQGETLRSVLSELTKYPHILIYVDPAEKDILPDFNYSIQYSTQGKYNANTWLVASSNLDNVMSNQSGKDQ